MRLNKFNIAMIIWLLIWLLTVIVVIKGFIKQETIYTQGKDSTIVVERMVHDTIKNIVVRWKTINDTIDNSDTISLVFIDSSSCLRIANDYYTKKVYNDTLVNDCCLVVYAIDTVYMNKLQKTTLNYYVKPQPIPFNDKSYFSTGVSTSVDLSSVNIIGGYSRKRLTWLGQYDLRRNVLSAGLLFNFK